MNKKFKLFLLVIVVFLLAGTTARADHPKGEVSVNLGWTFSDGVTGDSVLAADGNYYNSIAPKDAFSWGFTGSFFISDNAALGFRFNRQQSKLEIGGTNTVEVGDMNVDNYHAIFSYDFFNLDAKARPFMFGGIGATHYGSVDFTAGGQPRSIAGPTKFSTVWGGGMKLNATKNFGVRLEADWTPTYIKSDEAGWWCDPYWGCYLASNAKYSNQFTLGGGINIRF